MKKNKKMNICRIFLILNLALLIASCGTLKEGFKNQKKNTSDEFLVQKKSPLIMPPEYNKLPVPNQVNEEDEDKNNNSIKKLISTDKNGSEITKNQGSSKNFEDKLLEKIKNN